VRERHLVPVPDARSNSHYGVLVTRLGTLCDATALPLVHANQDQLDRTWPEPGFTDQVSWTATRSARPVISPALLLEQGSALETENDSALKTQSKEKRLMSARTKTVTGFVGAGIWLFLMCPVVHAQFGFVSGSDGTDGAFNPQESVEVDLSLAVTGQWDTTNGGGNGVYDPVQWAVVFKYTTIDIPPGVTVTFKNHPKCPPVVWLAQGDVTIGGVVSLDGGPGAAYTGPAISYAEPGPGGFRGGLHRTSVGAASGGFGPGGGHRGTGTNGNGAGGGGGRACTGSVGHGSSNASGGSAYGNVQILPLIGGSGGGGGARLNQSGSGGAGGGAILVASSGEIVLNGVIHANGGTGGDGQNFSQFPIGNTSWDGGGGGAGGAIRLIANSVSGSGGLTASGGPATDHAGAGGCGRIRVESADNSLPYPNSAAMGPVFPPAGAAATLQIARIDGEPVTSDPDCGIVTVDTPMGNPGLVAVVIQATNVPDGASVDVILTPARGDISVMPGAATVSGGAATAMVTFPAGRNEIQVRATWTP